jgi:hypothetical protein
MKQEGNRKVDMGLSVFVVQLNCPLRDFQTGLERPVGVFGPAIGIVDYMGVAD